MANSPRAVSNSPLRLDEGIRPTLLTGRESVAEDAEDTPGFRYVVLPRRLPN